MPHQQPIDEQRMDAVQGPQRERMAAQRGHESPDARRHEERPRAEEAERLAAALRDGRRLASPPTPPAVGTGATDEEARRADIAAEEDVLRGLRRVLADLADAPADVFVTGGDAGWRALAETDAAAGPSLGRMDWPTFPRGEALVTSAARFATVWAALGPWHEQGARAWHAAALVPVLVGDELRAVAAVGVAESTDDTGIWLAATGAVAGFAAAGIQALRLERRAQAEARARDAYISLAAHELRSPLTSVKGYAQLLLRQARKNPISDSMRRSIESIEQQSMRMAEMVGEMLDASRIRRGRLDVACAPTDLVALARRIVERRAAFYPQHELALETDEPALVGDYDAVRVEQVLRDLIDNAARHSPSGGAVEVHLAREGADAVVDVRDRGIGVPATDRERIFDYLYRTPTSEQRNLSGLGLGLFVSRHLIERMGGRLTLRASSTEGPTGSTFRIALPLAQPAR